MKQSSVQHMISLLKRKNSYLVDFKILNTEELDRIKSGDLNNLEAFYYDREILLNAMGRIDKELSHYTLDQFEDVSESSKKTILDLLKNKKQFIRFILNQDMQIHDNLNSTTSFTEESKIA